MDLRDKFAVHFAAALVGAFPDPEQIARRAYDLADALLDERARRIDWEEARAITLDSRRDSIAPPLPEHHAALLDEPMFDPDDQLDEELDPRWQEPPYDPSWDVEPRWPEASGEAAASEKGRPGLARTQPPEASEIGKERSA